MPKLLTSRVSETSNPVARRRMAGALALSLLLTFLAFSRTLTFGFVFDDRQQIVNNSYIRSWQYVARFFIAQVWNFNDPHSAGGNYYRPAFLLWLLINRTLFGLHPLLWHLTNVLLHVAVTGLVFLIVKELAADNVTALVSALVFGLHPVHIESVAWLSGVTDPLAAFWAFFSFWTYVVWRRKQGKRWLVASLASYAVAMLAKETALALPIILVAYEWLWDKPGAEQAWLAGWRRRLAEWSLRLAGYAVLTLAYLIVRWQVLQGLGHTTTWLPPATILMTWPLILTLYVEHLFWPFGLSAFYNVPYVSRPEFRHFTLPVLVLAAIAALLHLWARRVKKASPQEAKLVAFGCIWLLGFLLPLADLAVFAEGDIVHDRYLYIPSLGFALLVALGVQHLKAGKMAACELPASQLVVVGSLLALLGVATALQGHYWSDDLLLYSRGVADLPNNDTLRTNLANVLWERGRHAEAIHLYAEVLDRNPNSWSHNATLTRIDLANALGESDRYSDAIKLYLYVIEHSPNNWSANYNLGYTEYKVGNLAEAQKFLQRAIAINDLHGDQYLYLGMTELKLNQVPQAEQSFRKAISIKPGGFAYHLALGLALKLEGKPAAAIKEFRKELANYPAETAAHDQIRVMEKLLSSGNNHAPPAAPAGDSRSQTAAGASAGSTRHPPE